MMIVSCKGCGAKIFYARSENAKYIPLDAEILPSTSKNQ
jgi:hypothetical protein